MRKTICLWSVVMMAACGGDDNPAPVDGGGDARADSGGNIDLGGTVDTAPDSNALPDMGPLDAPSNLAFNDTCAKADVIAWAGSPITRSGDLSRATNQVNLPTGGCVPNGSAGPDLFYSVQLPAGKFRISVVSNGAFDPALYVLTSCAPVTCDVGSDRSGASETDELIVEPDADTGYLIGVDTWGQDIGTFTLTIEEATAAPDGGPSDAGVSDADAGDGGLTPDAGCTAPTNDTCLSAQALSWTGSTVTVSGDTSCASDELSLPPSACTGDDTAGPDVFYEITLPAGDYSVELTPDGFFDAALYVLSSCSPAACVGGSDNIGSGVTESVTLSPTTTTTYVIGADSWSGFTSGAFTLQIATALPPDGGVADGATTDGATPDAAADAGVADAAVADSGTPADGATPDSAADSGTPDSGTPDSGTPDSGTPDSGTPVDAGAPPKIVITELMINPAVVSDTNGEYIELYNAGSSTVSLANWTISDNVKTHTINSSGLTIAAGAYLVLTRDGQSSTNGGISPDYVYGSDIRLNNDQDTVVLRDAGGTVIDQVPYFGNWPYGNGASMSLASPTSDGSNLVNWCTETSAWSGSAGDKGTPGAAAGCTP